MHCSLALLLVFPFLFPFTTASITSDVVHLSNIASQDAAIIYGSLNGTILLNTSAMVSQMSTAIQNANSRLPNTRPTNLTSLDNEYLNYLDELHNMADAVQRRGRLFHSEMNLPVYQALQALSSIVHTYGTSLRARRIVGTDSVIRTMTTGSDIVNAQAAWVQNANYPGKKRALRRREQSGS